MKKLINVKEASKYLNVNESGIRYAVFTKKIPFVKIGRLVRFNTNDLDKYIEKNTQE